MLAASPHASHTGALRFAAINRTMLRMSDSQTSGALNGRQLQTLAALADVLLPHGGPFPLGATDVDAAGKLSHYLMLFAPSRRRQIARLITAWEYGSLLSRPPQPFSRLDPAAP